MRSIFFLATEEKEYTALFPLYAEMSELNTRTYFLKFFDAAVDASSVFSLFLENSFPIVVAATPSSLHYVSVLRPRWSYTAVGCEHGISPFKKYTYSPVFLDYDYYLAPTDLWLTRLQTLYPNRKTRFYQGDYPRLEELREKSKNIEISGIINYIPKYILDKKEKIQLVIFTWGINEKILQSMPDKVGIIYLLHPAQKEFLKDVSFKNACIVISNQNITPKLIGFSDIIFGDLSSLTIEAASIKKDTYLVLDGSLYTEDHDFDDGLMDRNSPRYATVPETDVRIGDEYILSLEDLRMCLEQERIDEAFRALSLDDRLLPPKRSDKLSLCAEKLISLAKRDDDSDKNHEEKKYQKECIAFLVDSYRLVLNRDPDHVGLEAYMRVMKETQETPLVTGLTILLALARSDEGRAVSQRQGISWPRIVMG